MNGLIESIGSLPWGVHAVVALVMAAGLIVWLSGKRFLKPMVVTICTLIGAAAAMLAVPALGGSSGESPISMGQGLLIGVIGGALVGLLMYRPALAVGMGLLFGTLAPITVATFLEHRQDAATQAAAAPAEVPATEPDLSDRMAAGIAQLKHLTNTTLSLANDPSLSKEARDALTDIQKSVDSQNAAANQMQNTPSPREGAGGRVSGSSLLSSSLLTIASSSSPSAPSHIQAFLPDAQQHVREFLTDAQSRASDRWKSLPLPQQGLVILAGVLGLAGGVVMGLMMPGWAAGCCASMLGAGLWLPSFAWLSQAFAAPWRGMLDRSPAQWIAMWAIASVLGMGLQIFTSRRARRLRSIPPPQDPADKTRVI